MSAYLRLIRKITQTIDYLSVSVALLHNAGGVEDVRELLLEKIRQLIEKIDV